MKYPALIATALLFLLSACCTQHGDEVTQFQPEPAPTTDQHVVNCPEQRPEICTREYRPVCATRDTGVRCVTTPCPSTEQRTYSNGCSACADEKVISYRLDACGDAAQSLQ